MPPEKQSDATPRFACKRLLGCVEPKTTMNKCESCGVNFVFAPETPPEERAAIKTCVRCQLKTANKALDAQAAIMRSLANKICTLETVLDKVLSCTNGHFNPLFRCGCYEQAHELIMGKQPNESSSPTAGGGGGGAH